MAKQCPGCPELYNLHSFLPWESKDVYDVIGWEFCPRCKQAMVGHIGLMPPTYEERSKKDLLSLISND